MNVVMLTNIVAPDKSGGLERYVHELSEKIGQAGHSVTVIAKSIDDTHRCEQDPDNDVRIFKYRAPKKGSRLFAVKYPFTVVRSVSKLLREVESRHSDDSPLILHAHYPIPALVLVARRRPYVYTFHAPVHAEILGEHERSYWLPSVVGRLAVWTLRHLERIVLRRAKVVICLSRFTMTEAERLGADSSRIRLIPGGIDVSSFASHSQSNGASPFSERGSPQLFAARRLVARTGIEELVRAFDLVRNACPNARLAIAGTGPRLGSVRELIRRLGLTDAIDLLGRVSESDLRAAYASADICVTPTQHLEGFGLSTAEALAAGSCPLVTPVGANAEVVEKLGADFVTRDATPSGIAEGVIGLWARPEKREQARSIGKKVVASYDWSEVVAAVCKVYSEYSA